MHSLGSVLNKRWVFFLCLVVFYSITLSKVYLYFCLLTDLIILISICFKGSSSRQITGILEFVFLSILMPDNYVIILAITACAIFSFRYLHISKFAPLLIFALAFLLFNSIYNSVPIQNIVMWAIYFLPFPMIFCSLFLLSKYGMDLRPTILLLCKRLILVEAASVIVFALTHLDLVVTYEDMDWVVGTLGEYQANTLMCLSSFALLVFSSTVRAGNKENIFWCVIALLLMVSTSSVSYILVFCAAAVLVALFSSSIKNREKLVIFGVLITGASLFVLISPSWISHDILSMLKPEYAAARFKKLDYYKDTFIELPRDFGIDAALFGTGVGTYSSRAALTCAGGYIGIYDDFIEPVSSPARKKYFSDEERWRGLASMADSSIISVQGEFGYIGTLMLISFFLLLLRKSNDSCYRICLLFFIGLLFVDNALEYAKFFSAFSLTRLYLLKPSAKAIEPVIC